MVATAELRYLFAKAPLIPGSLQASIFVDHGYAVLHSIPLLIPGSPPTSTPDEMVMGSSPPGTGVIRASRRAIPSVTPSEETLVAGLSFLFIPAGSLSTFCLRLVLMSNSLILYGILPQFTDIIGKSNET